METVINVLSSFWCFVLLTSSEVELMETLNLDGDTTELQLLTSSEVELMETGSPTNTNIVRDFF